MKKKSEIIRITKYLFSAVSSFLIDLTLFTIFNIIFSFLGNISIIISTIIARIISSLYNYFFNSKYVFCNYSKISIIKYYILVVIQMLISASSVYLINLNFDSINDTIIKGIIDIVIFIINYIMQKTVVFKWGL